MDGIEEKLNQLLSDPDSMAQIMSLVQSIAPAAEPPQMNDAALQSALQLLQSAQQSDPNQEALLCALKPYVRPERREKIDRAMQIARISHLASCAIRSFGPSGSGKTPKAST